MIDIRQLPDRWRRLPVPVRDLPFAVVLIGLSLLPQFHGVGTQVGTMATRDYDAVALVAIVLQCLPMAVRRLWPSTSLLLVVAGFLVDQLGSYHSLATLALPLALLSTSAHLERRRRLTIALLTVAYVPIAYGMRWYGIDEPASEFALFYLALALFWCAGSWLRSARRAEVERRRRIAEATRTAERTRIARELHDVVTHHVTAMVVQTEAARYLTAAPERLDQTLTAVTDTGRRAISDLRHLLDVLNPDHEADFAPPSVGELDALIEQTRRAGQPVEFVEEGARAEVTGSAEFTAYRVVQEALTNALKYAHGSQTVVRLRYRERDITVDVDTDGTGSRSASPGGGGRGLAGLRERVEALSGEFDADHLPGGGFAVRSRIPTGAGK